MKGYKFRRQFPIGNYILDFYCCEKCLAIEIDGKSHDFDNQFEYDLKRTKYLQAQGIVVVRFSNTEILNNLESVLEHLQQELQ